MKQKASTMDCYAPLKINTEKEFTNLLDQKDNDRKNIQIKTYQYFPSSSDNKWNNPSYMSEKYYKYYHQQQDHHAPIIEALVLDSKIKQNEAASSNMKEKVLRSKSVANELRKNRKLERFALQLESNQKIFDAEKNDELLEKLSKMKLAKFKAKVTKKSLATEILKREPKNAWNDYSKICNKYLDVVLMPSILKSEERAAEMQEQKLKKQSKQANLIDKYRDIVHDVIYYDQKCLMDNNRTKFTNSKILGRPNLRKKKNSEEKIAEKLQMNQTQPLPDTFKNVNETAEEERKREANLKQKGHISFRNYVQPYTLPKYQEKELSDKAKKDVNYMETQTKKTDQEYNKTNTSFNQNSKTEQYRITNNFSNTIGKYDSINMFETKTNFELVDDKNKTKTDMNNITQTDSFNKKNITQTDSFNKRATNDATSKDTKYNTKNSFNFQTTKNSKTQESNKFNETWHPSNSLRNKSNKKNIDSSNLKADGVRVDKQYLKGKSKFSNIEKSPKSSKKDIKKLQIEKSSNNTSRKASKKNQSKSGQNTPRHGEKVTRKKSRKITPKNGGKTTPRNPFDKKLFTAKPTNDPTLYIKLDNKSDDKSDQSVSKSKKEGDSNRHFHTPKNRQQERGSAKSPNVKAQSIYDEVRIDHNRVRKRSMFSRGHSSKSTSPNQRGRKSEPGTRKNIKTDRNVEVIEKSKKNVKIDDGIGYAPEPIKETLIDPENLQIIDLSQKSESILEELRCQTKDPLADSRYSDFFQKIHRNEDLLHEDYKHEVKKAQKIYKIITNIGYKKNNNYDVEVQDKKLKDVYQFYLQKMNEEDKLGSQNNGDTKNSQGKDTNTIEKKLRPENILEFKEMHIRNFNNQTAFLENNYIKRLKSGNAITRKRFQEILNMKRPDIKKKIQKLVKPCQIKPKTLLSEAYDPLKELNEQEAVTKEMNKFNTKMKASKYEKQFYDSRTILKASLRGLDSLETSKKTMGNYEDHIVEDQFMLQTYSIKSDGTQAFNTYNLTDPATNGPDSELKKSIFRASSFESPLSPLKSRNNSSIGVDNENNKSKIK